jgi:hypothetical protein
MRNHKIVNIDSLMIHVVIALDPGLFREGMRAIIDGTKNNRSHKPEIIFVDKRTSRRRKNGASVIRASVLKHRSILGLVNPRGKLSDIIKKDEKRCYSLIQPYFMVLYRVLERKAEMEPTVEKMTDGRIDIDVLLQMRFIVVQLFEFESHFLDIDFRVLYAFMTKICPELDVSNEEVTGKTGHLLEECFLFQA